MNQTTNYAGIDYGLGKSNLNPQTGIRFGVKNPQLYAMTPKQQIIVFSRHVCRTVRCAKNAYDHRPLIRMAQKDLATLWNTAIRLNQPAADTARRCAIAIERMMK